MSRIDEVRDLLRDAGAIVCVNDPESGARVEIRFSEPVDAQRLHKSLVEARATAPTETSARCGECAYGYYINGACNCCGSDQEENCVLPASTEVAGERCTVQCDACACSTFGVPGSACMSLENDCTGTMRAIAAPADPVQSEAEGGPRWCLACGNPTVDPYCAECTERYRTMIEPSTTTPTTAVVEAAKEVAAYLDRTTPLSLGKPGVDAIAAIISKYLPAQQPVELPEKKEETK